MTEQKFLEFAPKGFDPTMELKWICTIITTDEAVHQDKDLVAIVYPVLNPMLHYNQAVLCQKWQGAFRSVWVRVPME